MALLCSETVLHKHSLTKVCNLSCTINVESVVAKIEGILMQKTAKIGVIYQIDVREVMKLPVYEFLGIVETSFTRALKYQIHEMITQNVAQL